MLNSDLCLVISQHWRQRSLQFECQALYPDPEDEDSDDYDEEYDVEAHGQGQGDIPTSYTYEER